MTSTPYFCHSCGRGPTRTLVRDGELLLCLRCRRSLRAAAQRTDTTVGERWQAMFKRVTKRR